MKTSTRGNLIVIFFPINISYVFISYYGEVPKIEMREMKYLKKS